MELMKVYVLMEYHIAEGSGVLGIFTQPIPEDQVRKIGRERSTYSDDEADKIKIGKHRWIEYGLEEHEVEE